MGALVAVPLIGGWLAGRLLRAWWRRKLRVIPGDLVADVKEASGGDSS